MSLNLFAPSDMIAVILLIGLWLGTGWIVEHPPATRPSVSWIMRRYRREWMQAHVTRQPRIFDASLLATFRQGTTFFASTALIAVGSGLAVLGNPETLTHLAEDFAIDRAPVLLWQSKIALALFFAVNAVLKFIWAHRLFGYVAITMGAVPNDESAAAYGRAAQAGELLITAARSYEGAMRAIYFGLAALAWLAGPWALMGAAVLTCLMLMRREFASTSRRALLESAP